MVSSPISRIAVTPGEPAGIGPDLLIQLAAQPRTAELIVIGDPELLRSRAELMDIPLWLTDYDEAADPEPGKAGELLIAPVAMGVPSVPGSPDPANGPYVVETLKRAVQGCLGAEFDALVTAPVQKSVVTESGTPFSGHTEFLASLCDVDAPVMLLCAGTLRVALLTTHLALADVPAQINEAQISAICRVLVTDLQRLFDIESPRIAVLGLNPHAGEAGQLGSEERDVIEPTLEKLRLEGFNLIGPLPADSAFTPASLDNFDAILSMYHDQGLPVLKYAGFGNAVNVTLGLPIIRTSVDHGTALELAGTGKADNGSMRAALQLAEELALRTRI
ncbi:MAG: 4-hydroxythreonine-4-phosphate dehydrogenase PdxA [Gammaproteobacteria bacterium]|nr:4-hydroxythreonine-4-phosphate dehydrogenase PdxA [Chromatiales bacterium]MDP7271680.1 4-hydroxythreonine-4-phosphate dehydrogenase PdxA [Gammaproteobacteria bacterium]MDP7660663.1 4-hydroxythreonine-4-phosphate dehydrogenase PdxA [Gammaproteobacteria bacterium]